MANCEYYTALVPVVSSALSLVSVFWLLFIQTFTSPCATEPQRSVTSYHPALCSIQCLALLLSRLQGSNAVQWHSFSNCSSNLTLAVPHNGWVLANVGEPLQPECHYGKTMSLDHLPACHRLWTVRSSNVACRHPATSRCTCA